MKIELGLRGSSDCFHHVIVKMDDLMLMNTENLFRSGQEYRTKIGRSLIPVSYTHLTLPTNREV